MTRAGIFWIALSVSTLGWVTDAHSCDYYCRQGRTPTRSYITDTDRRIVGDRYDPGHGRRVQIRDVDRRIVGYIIGDGTVTNTRRQIVGAIR